MSNVKNESAANDEKQKARDEKKKARDEVIELIDEFMGVSEYIGQESIAQMVYEFLQPHGAKHGLRTYQQAAAVGLTIFARDPKLCKEVEKRFGIYYIFLCEMLQKIVDLCNNIRNNEINMAHLDKCKLETFIWPDVSMKEILEDKIKYTHKIQYQRELTDMEKRVI